MTQSLWKDKLPALVWKIILNGHVFYVKPLKHVFEILFFDAQEL